MYFKTILERPLTMPYLTFITNMLLFVIYQCITILSIPFLALYLVIRKLRGKVVWGKLSHRIGLIPLPPHNKNIIWLHAVSAGEVLSLEYLIKKIQAEDPSVHCYVTVGTQSGYTLAKKHLPSIALSYLPYDFLPIIMLTLNRINPKALIITEAELWPNVLTLTTLYNIPSYLINARISKKSPLKQTLYNATLSRLFNCFTAIYTQDTATVPYLEKHVTKATSIQYGGTTKSFNVVKKIEDFKKQHAEENSTTSPVLLVGSCHPGELAVYLKLFDECKKTIPNLKLVLVPRHMHWQTELVTQLTQTNNSWQIINDANGFTSFDNTLANNDIVAVFLMGTLFSLYRYATLFFLGGTWVPVGGHNLLEPAAWGIPSIVGPDYHTCTELVTTLHKQETIFIAQDTTELSAITHKLLHDTTLRTATTKKLLQWLKHEALTTEAIFNTLLSQLKVLTKK